MRLLQRSSTGTCHLTKLFTSDDAIPPYAILSHTWGEDFDEVTFDDLANGTGTDKPGYKKIRFCAEQTRQDNLDYFWIDTCCINKANKAELSNAINSMYRWYRNAVRCYVYLSDVSTAKRRLDGDIWEPAFRSSRWFTRGWTLQELLAPHSVEFFSRECKRLGDKDSLCSQIHEITAIPVRALQGESLSYFSVNNRLSWMENRQTKREEDKVYSLLGIFGVYISPFYGEGMGKALTRLQNEIEKLEKCMRDLHVTDPRGDKARIEETKGGLLEESYNWIFQNRDFLYWLNNLQSRLLWIKGDPGKGKTMLLCGIINELSKSMAKTALLSYFFCQAIDSRINHATAVLRGLIYLLIYQQPSLVSHVQKKYDYTGNKFFEDANVWALLSGIFIDIVQDPSRESAYLIIDALDECISDLPKLLDLIVQTSSASSRVKWIISSRNWPDIEERLDRAEDKVRVSLELNADSVSAAVRSYIKHKVSRLAKDKKYSDQTNQAVLDYLYTNANNTFLWAALVCQNLDKMSRLNVVTKLKAFPPGLDSLYTRMIKNINDSDDADLCRRVLAIIAVVYRPVTLQELTSFMEPCDMGESSALLPVVIGYCGSLLTVRDSIIYFVHQSAKDFLLKKASHVIFPSGSEVVHFVVFSRSLLAMSNTLKRDIYDLSTLGYSIEQVQQPEPDPLATLRYSCIYWIDHLYDWSTCASAHAEEVLRSGGTVDSFLRHKCLYLLEALSLCKSMSKGVVSIGKLEVLTKNMVVGSSLVQIVQDLRRFIMYHKSAIEHSPLQVYSALLFTPTQSVIRALFKDEEPKEIVVKPGMQDKWSNCLMTLEGHSDSVWAVAFSHDSTLLASASWDSTVNIWDAQTGECLLMLEDHSDRAWAVAFSHDSTLLASASSDNTVKVWDARSGECQLTLEGHSNSVRSVAFSHDSTWLASGSDDGMVKLWDPCSGECLSTLKGYSGSVFSVAFSHDSTWLVSGSSNGMVKIWDPRSGQCLLTLKSGRYSVSSVAFSHNSTLLASTTGSGMVKVWDAHSGERLLRLKGHSGHVSSVVFSHDSTWLASAADDDTIKVWDAHSGECLSTIKGHSYGVNSVAFSHDSTWLASASRDDTVKVWDPRSGECPSTLEGHSNVIWALAFSHDSTQLASASADETAKLWDLRSNKCLLTLRGHRDIVNALAFSHDSTQLVSGSHDNSIKVWDPRSGECLLTLKGHSSYVFSVAFSHDSIWLASGSHDSTVKVWDAHSGECMSTLKGHSKAVNSVAFSHDSTLLVSASYDCTVKVWHPPSGDCLLTLKGDDCCDVNSGAFSHDSTRLASASENGMVKVWDTRSGKCISTLWVGSVLRSISFDITDSYLHTDIGIIDITASLSSRPSSVKPKPQLPQYRGLALSADRVWIKLGSHNLLWLPSEYRPSCSAVSEGVIAIGVGTGRVWTCEVQSSKS